MIFFKIRNLKKRLRAAEKIIYALGITDDYDTHKHLPNDRELRKLIQEWQRLKMSEK